MRLRRLLAVLLAVCAVLAVAIYERADDLEAQRQDLVAQAVELAAGADDAEARGAHLTGLLAQAQQESSELSAVQAVRGDFADELKSLRAAMKKAKGKVDTSSQRTAALSTQKTVRAERQDPEIVVTGTATIHALVEKIDAEVSAWDRAQAARAAQVARGAPAGPHHSSSGASGYARVRAALDRVGGRGIGLYESSSCGGSVAPACANSNGYIKYRADIANWSTGRLNWAMAHELAHIYQFRVWGSLNDSSAYRSKFHGDPEFLANCMAVVRGYPGSVGCNADQRAWASGIWVGAVR